MKKRILALFALFLSALCYASERDEMMRSFYDEEIELLTDLKDKYEAKVARFQDQGDRLQFQSGSLYEARRYWERAQVAGEIVKRLDGEIQKLRTSKNEV